MPKIEKILWVLFITFLFTISFGVIVGVILHDVPGAFGKIFAAVVAICGVIAAGVAIKGICED